ncbi:MAG TPA: response regulator [Sphingomonadales bacterium]
MTVYALSRAYKALLVEGNPYHIRITESMLRQCGVKTVIRAVNNGEAMQVLFEQKVDLVVCDYDVPADGGIGLLRTIRNRHVTPQYRVPVIVTCGSADIEKVTAARDAGATEFLSKPFSANLLWRALYSALENGRPFIESESYVGPDRRRRDKQPATERRGRSRAARAAAVDEAE